MIKKNIKKQNKERGSAIVETLPLIIIFITILGNIWGFFMAVHSGILASIGARAYAFETFRNRADLTYFRDQDYRGGAPSSSATAKINYLKTQVRVHAVVQTGAEKTFQPMPVDYSRFSLTKTTGPDKTKSHAYDTIFSEDRAPDDGGVKKIWLRSNYGMCLNFKAC